MRNWMFCSTSGTKHFKLHLTICELEGLLIDHVPNKDNYNLQVHVKLEIPKKGHIPRIAIQKDYTSKQRINPDGRVSWNEDFEQSCSLDVNSRSPRSWKIELEVHGIDVESNPKSDILAKVKIDVTELTSHSEKSVKLPVNCRIGGVTHEAILKVKLEVIEVEKNHTKNIVHPISPTHLLPSFLSCVSFQNQNQTRNKMEMESSQSETEEETDQSYQRIKTIDLIRSQSLHETIIYKNQGKEQATSYEVLEKTKLTRLLSWNLRKKPKDAPLLNKANGEGGDDIDNARRTLLSYLKPRKDRVKSGIKDGEFMDSARFEVGKWEKRTIKSRDGKLELQTEIFLATIDQRSEKALGGGACTVIATLITDWLYTNPNTLPLKCELDKLIRDGSREWRSLCEEEIHKGKFLDQHFDLDTVIQAKIRPLEVVSEKSYVGFFKLENVNDLDVLQDAMSFDTIWDEIQNGESSSEGVYIVSWNDHFFVLKKERNEIYIIDTLGERLAEGCDKAYILKFNEDSMVFNVQPQLKTSKVETEGVDNHASVIKNEEQEKEKENSPEFACKGTSCCKEFIKGFLAAIPLGELQSNVEKGINGNAPLHQLLQIEFHYMSPLQQNSTCVDITN
ncbi:putative NT-type C2 domain-containing protein [Helianthus annuus]|nr:putative NT-type C2 domain-containing protein [Helianthus annuus]